MEVCASQTPFVVYIRAAGAARIRWPWHAGQVGQARLCQKKQNSRQQSCAERGELLVKTTLATVKFTSCMPFARIGTLAELAQRTEGASTFRPTLVFTPALGVEFSGGFNYKYNTRRLHAYVQLLCSEWFFCSAVTEGCAGEAFKILLTSFISDVCSSKPGATT